MSGHKQCLYTPLKYIYIFTLLIFQTICILPCKRGISRRQVLIQSLIQSPYCKTALQQCARVTLVSAFKLYVTTCHGSEHSYYISVATEESSDLDLDSSDSHCYHNTWFIATILLAVLLFLILVTISAYLIWPCIRRRRNALVASNAEKEFLRGNTNSNCNGSSMKKRTGAYMYMSIITV